MGKKITIVFDGDKFNASSEAVLKFSNLTIDPNKQTAFLKNEDLNLTPTEFNQLLLLAKNKGKVLSREYIIRHTKGNSEHTDSRSIDVIISHIRNKLKGGIEEHFIKTIHSIGYIFLAKKERKK